MVPLTQSPERASLGGNHQRVVWGWGSPGKGREEPPGVRAVQVAQVYASVGT